MTGITKRKAVLLGLAALAGIGAAPPANRANWNNTVAVTPAGTHVLGNPAAKVKLVEYVSYTCPHCAHFEREGESALRVGYVAPGKVSVEVRNFVRDPIDMAAALLTNCGDSRRFFLRHTAFLRGQDRWLATMQNAGQLQRQRWQSADFKARMRFIATDFGFYAIAASQGIDRKTADVCLADEAKARRLAENTRAGEDLGVRGTPSFLINGNLLTGTHEWQALELQLQARL